MYRYNPDTNRRTKVRADSYEADAWPSRKPAKKSATQKRVEQQLIRRAETVVQRRVVPKVASAAGQVTIGQAALAAIAGIASYYGTTYILDQIASGATDPRFIAAMAFRKAHVALAEKLGRQPTREELHELQQQVIRAVGVRLAVVRSLPFGLGELLSALTKGRI